MARTKPIPQVHETPSIPLADFFWIAGVDGQDILDTYIRLGESANGTNGVRSQSALSFGETIEEDQDAEHEASSILESPRPTSRRSKRSSYQRLSRLSGEAQMSIQSLDESLPGTSSKRSSATIRAVPSPGPRASVLMNGQDFDEALKQFATDRESFYLDLNFSAGAVTQPSKPKPKPKTQKIVGEDVGPGLSRGLGSIRRHMSFREMNSMRRQPSVARQGMNYGPVKSSSALIQSSLCQDLKEVEQLQLRDPCSGATQHCTQYAPPEAQVRACPPRPIPA